MRTRAKYEIRDDERFGGNKYLTVKNGPTSLAKLVTTVKDRETRRVDIKNEQHRKPWTI